MSEENRKDLDYQEIGIPRLIIGNVQRRIDSIGGKVSRLFAELSAIGGDEHAMARVIYGNQDTVSSPEIAEPPVDKT